MAGWVERLASPYGDPEAALMVEPDDDHSRLRDADVVADLLSCLRPLDRILWQARTNGVSQEALAEAFGFQQASVSARETKLKAWVVHVLPLRKRLRKLPEPLWLTDIEWDIYQRVVWHHQSTSFAARELGLRQSTVYQRWLGARARFARQGTPDQAALMVDIANDMWGWCAPITMQIGADSPVVVRKKPVMPEIDHAALVIYELDLHAALDALEPRSDPKPKMVKKSKPKPKPKPRYGKGNLNKPGLHLADRHKDIRALYHRYFSGGAIRAGLDPDDVLQEVYAGFLIRQEGTSGFNPKRSTWSTYSYMVIQSVVRNVVRKAKVRRRRDQQYEQVSTTDMHYEDDRSIHVLVAEPGYDPAHYEELIEQMKDVAWEQAGDEGMAYVEHKLDGGSIGKADLTTHQKVLVRKAIRSRMVAIQAQ
jgi:DNA-directed RNA polymerase specialized sigma24 family protein